MSSIVDLWQEEPLTLDPERLADIYIEMGERQAQVVVLRAAEDLRLARQRLHGLLRSERLSCLSRAALRMAILAESLGLSSLERVARDVAVVSERHDHMALSATLARLDRVSERSLKIVTDLHDMSG